MGQNDFVDSHSHLYAGRSLLEASPALARYTGLDGSSLGGRCIHCCASAEEEVNVEARQRSETRI